MAAGVWKDAFPYVFGPSGQLSQNKFFDQSASYIRKKVATEDKQGRRGGGIDKDIFSDRVERRLLVTILVHYSRAGQLPEQRVT